MSDSPHFHSRFPSYQQMLANIKAIIFIIIRLLSFTGLQDDCIAFKALVHLVWVCPLIYFVQHLRKVSILSSILSCESGLSFKRNDKIKAPIRVASIKGK